MAAEDISLFGVYDDFFIKDGPVTTEDSQNCIYTPDSLFR